MNGNRFIHFIVSRGRLQKKKGKGDKMPRKARQKSSTKVYHIIVRGNAKQDIFLEKQDYSKFIKEMYQTKEKYRNEIYSYCLMSNHVHLVIYDKKENLSKILQSLTISYSSYWNKKYERVGHLFQDRFLSKSIETQSYLRTVCRYIHQNPCKSGVAEMETYRWSSYQESIKENKIIDEKQVLSLFGQDRQEAINNFIQFHKINKKENKIKDLMEYEMVERLNDEQATKYLIEILQLENIQQVSKYNIKERKDCLRKLKNIKGVSCLQIARITGFSRKMIEVIRNE